MSEVHPKGACRHPEAVVFDVQRFSIHDGPGIRTTVFFKGCALDCRWCQNPEGRARRPELSYHADRCLEAGPAQGRAGEPVACGRCLPACPENALLDRVLDRVRWDACTHCGACVEVCPSRALVQVGERYTAERLLAEVLTDQPFYEASGGGVTLSGGEPVLHAKFLREFLPRARAAGLDLTLETSGQYPFGLLEPLLPELDRVFFDVKAGGRERHLQLVGRDDALIFANLAALLGRPDRPEVEVRMPVIPGLNDGEDSIAQLAARLLALGVTRLTLLPYNHLWEAKLAHLDTHQVPLGVEPQPPEYYEHVAERFAAHGIAAHPS